MARAAPRVAEPSKAVGSVLRVCLSIRYARIRVGRVRRLTSLQFDGDQFVGRRVCRVVVLALYDFIFKKKNK